MPNRLVDAALEQLPQRLRRIQTRTVAAGGSARWSRNEISMSFDVKVDGIRSVAKVGRGRVYEMALALIENPVSGAGEELYLD